MKLDTEQDNRLQAKADEAWEQFWKHAREITQVRKVLRNHSVNYALLPEQFPHSGLWLDYTLREHMNHLYEMWQSAEFLVM